MVEARHATPDDLDRIVSLLEIMHGETAIVSLNREKVAVTVSDAIDNNGVCVLEKGGEIVASIGMHEYELWYSRESVLQDIWLYIHPNHRSLNMFTMLIQAARSLADIKGRPLFICLQSIRDHDRKDILFRRYMEQVMKAYLFQPCGGYYQA